MPNIHNINIICIYIYVHILYIIYTHISQFMKYILTCYNTLRRFQQTPGTYPRPSTTCYEGNPSIFVFWASLGMFQGSGGIFLEIPKQNQNQNLTHNKTHVVKSPPRSPPSFATKMNGWLPLRISGGPALQAAVNGQRCSWLKHLNMGSWGPKPTRWCFYRWCFKGGTLFFVITSLDDL